MRKVIGALATGLIAGSALGVTIGVATFARIGGLFYWEE